MKIIQSYLHGESLGISASIGVLVEVETDTSGKDKRELLNELGRELALQIAATNPSHIGEKQFHDVPNGDVDNKSSEPGDLLIQGWIKDPDKLIGDLIYECETKIGAPVKINRFVRYEADDT